MNLINEILFVIVYFVTGAYSWQYFTVLSEVGMPSGHDDTILHSEYRYGKCDDFSEVMFYTHVHLDHTSILGKPIVRGYIDVVRIPNCIILRAKAYTEDLFRNTAHSFQICVPRITYSHEHRRYMYYYYEWYLPSDMYGGMNWDLYFFGPLPTDVWAY